MFSPLVALRQLTLAALCCLGMWSGHDVLGFPVSVYEQPSSLTASIYANGSNPARLLFKFRRTSSISGSKVHVLREYTYPDGRVAAREQVIYDGDRLESYELQELQTDSFGLVTLHDDPKSPGKRQARFEYNKDLTHGTHGRTSTETVSSGALVNDMIGAFLSSNFERIDRGQKVSCRYIVVSRRETVGLSFSKESDTTYEGRPAITLKLQPTSRLISVLVDPLYFVVDKAPPHHVLQYTGRTTPKFNEGDHWKDLDAVTVFDW